MTFRKFTFLFAVVAIAAAAALAGMRDAATSSEIAYVTEEEGGISEIDLSTMKVISAIWEAAEGADARFHSTLGRCQPVSSPGTLPAYGAGGRLR